MVEATTVVTDLLVVRRVVLREATTVVAAAMTVRKVALIEVTTVVAVAMAVRRVALKEATTVVAPLVSLGTLHCTRVQYGLVYHIGSKLPTKVALLEAKREYFQGPLALCRFVFVARVFVGVVAAAADSLFFV